MKKLIISFSAALISMYASAQFQVGHMTKTFIDPAHGNRPIDTEIYYPAVSTGNNTTAAAGEYPVIVFGHGFVMAWDAYTNLWEEFVPRGYIMVFPRTEGNAFSTNHQNFGWDLQFLVTELQNEGALASSLLFNKVAPETALMGHSMGGGAAFLAADSLCANGNTNLKTLIGLAPAESSTNGVSSIASAANVTVPALILSGVQDGVTPPNDHHIPMYSALASTCKTILNLIGGAHCYFANSNFACDFGESTSSTGISISRTQQHAITFDFVNLWLDYTLKNKCNGFSIFQDSLATSNRITSNQVCNIVIPTIDLTLAQTTTTLTSNQNGADTYQWINCANNSIIPGAQNQSYSPTLNGSYAVIITTSGCKDTSNCVNFTGSLGLTDLAFSSIQLFPNPTTNSFSIQIADNQSYHLRITDLNGKAIFQQAYVSNGTVITTNDLAPGSYFITFSGEKQTITKRLIKE
ncbi:MAG: T9SS type A sorting domain-containing protein [Bacteroidota bacterium]